MAEPSQILCGKFVETQTKGTRGRLSLHGLKICFDKKYPCPGFPPARKTHCPKSWSDITEAQNGSKTPTVSSVVKFSP